MKKIILFVVFSLFLVSCGNKIKESKTNNVYVIIDSINHNFNKVIDSIKPEDIYLSRVVTLKDVREQSLYSVNCKFCHGDDGKGDGVKARLNPSLCPFDLTKESNSDNFVYCVLLNGKENMPGYSKKLDDSKIKVLVIYIKKFKK